jgi:outer membrane usher protein
MVAQGGRLYLRSESGQGRLQVVWGEEAGQQCSIDYVLPAAEGEQLDFIEVDATCR